MTQFTRQFVVTQPLLGSPLQFQPIGKELDQLIDAYIPGTLPIQQKKGQVSLEFLNAVDINSVFPVSFRYEVQLNVPTASAPRPSGPTKRLREESQSTNAPGSKRLPGFSILTKDGVDITEYASRGPKTKEQRDHAALMRKLKACPPCKRSKQRCDPSHHGFPAPSTASSSTSSHFSSSARNSFASQSSGSRTSVSPQSVPETLFSRNPPKAANLVAHAGKRFSPYDSPRSAFSLSDSPSQQTPNLECIEQRRLALLQQQAEIDAELAALSSPRNLTPTAHLRQASMYRLAPGTVAPSSNQLDPQLYSEPSFEMDELLWVPGLEDLEAFNATTDAQLASQFTYPAFTTAPRQSTSIIFDTPVSPHTSNRTPTDLYETQNSQQPVITDVQDFDIDQWLRPEADNDVRSNIGGPVQTVASTDKCFYVNGKPFDQNERPASGKKDFVLYPQGSESYWALDAQRDSRVMCSGHSPPGVLQQRSLSPDVVSARSHTPSPASRQPSSRHQAWCGLVRKVERYLSQLGMFFRVGHV